MSKHTGEPADRSQLRQEAAAWFARMRGPDAEQHRTAFEEWLARGAVHRGAYNRIAEIFSAGKHLKEERTSRAPRPRMLAFAAALLLLAGIALASVVNIVKREPASKITRAETPLVNVAGQVRHVTLGDGSRVTLDSDSLIVARFDAGTRRLQLERGRARFDVQHERRPFVVVAGDTKVTALGTLFDVRFASGGNVEVDLLRGAVAVTRAPGRPSTAPAPRPVLLRAGQSVTGRADGTLSVSAPRADRPAWPSKQAVFGRTPLAEVIAQANRYSVDQIVINDHNIAALTVSGTFRIDDSAQLAERLADLFDLEVDDRTPGRLLLRRPKQK